MKKLAICIELILIFILFSGCSKITEQKDIKIGKKYLFSFDWESEDPFEIKDIDTVKVVGLKEGYVQWQYKDSIKQSCGIRLFKKLIKQ